MTTINDNNKTAPEHAESNPGQNDNPLPNQSGALEPFGALMNPPNKIRLKEPMRRREPNEDYTIGELKRAQTPYIINSPTHRLVKMEVECALTSECGVTSEAEFRPILISLLRRGFVLINSRISYRTWIGLSFQHLDVVDIAPTDESYQFKVTLCVYLSEKAGDNGAFRSEGDLKIAASQLNSFLLEISGVGAPVFRTSSRDLIVHKVVANVALSDAIIGRMREAQDQTLAWIEKRLADFGGYVPRFAQIAAKIQFRRDSDLDPWVKYVRSDWYDTHYYHTLPQAHFVLRKQTVANVIREQDISAGSFKFVISVHPIGSKVVCDEYIISHTREVIREFIQKSGKCSIDESDITVDSVSFDVSPPTPSPLPGGPREGHVAFGVELDWSIKTCWLTGRTFYAPGPFGFAYEGDPKKPVDPFVANDVGIWIPAWTLLALVYAFQNKRALTDLPGAASYASQDFEQWADNKECRYGPDNFPLNWVNNCYSFHPTVPVEMIPRPMPDDSEWPSTEENETDNSESDAGPATGPSN